MSNGSHWICSPPLMCFKLPKTTVEQTKPRHKSIWSARVRTHWQEAGPVFFSTLHLLLVLSILTFLPFSLLIVVPLQSWFLPLTSWPLPSCFRVSILYPFTVDHTVLGQVDCQQCCSVVGTKRDQSRPVRQCLAKVVSVAEPFVHKCRISHEHSGSTQHAAEAS